MEDNRLKSERPMMRWCVLHNDFSLLLYKKQKDKNPESSIPIPGITIHYGEKELMTDSVVPKDARKKVYLF